MQRTYCDPYIIAEIGVNHEGSLDRAKRMIDGVARAGGHAAKFQTYKASTLASKTNSPAYWDTSKESTQSQFELFSKYDSFGEKEYLALAQHCADNGIDFLSTPFDLSAVSFLAPLMPAIKIASADLTNIPLLREVAATGRPVIMSVGASTFDEIDRSVDVLKTSGAEEISLLHCVLKYPTPPADANLRVILALQERYGDRVTIGYSDHVAPEADGNVPALLLASALGARVLEKHFTDDRTAPGNDHYHAFDEAGLLQFNHALKAQRELAGSPDPDIESQRSAIQNARRRIYMQRDLIAGEVLKSDDLIALRANDGASVEQWDEFIGKRLRVDKNVGQALLVGDVEGE